MLQHCDRQDGPNENVIITVMTKKLKNMNIFESINEYIGNRKHIETKL